MDRDKSVTESLASEWRKKNGTGKEVVMRQLWPQREALWKSGEKTDWGTGGWEWEGQWAAVCQDRGKKAVNNKLIRNGCKIAMDERLARVRRKKKANHWAVSCEPPSIMWGLTSYQQSEQELHLINQSWQLLLGHISSTAFPHPLLQLPLGFTFCWYQLHCCPTSVDFLSTGSVIPLVEKNNRTPDECWWR